MRLLADPVPDHLGVLTWGELEDVRSVLKRLRPPVQALQVVEWPAQSQRALRWLMRCGYVAEHLTPTTRHAGLRWTEIQITATGDTYLRQIGTDPAPRSRS